MQPGEASSFRLSLYPEVLWAQRTDVIYLTINVSDITVKTLDIQADRIKFEGTQGDKTYAFDLELFDKLNPEESKKAVSARAIRLILAKAEDKEYWPRLQKDKKKPHFLKTDFDLWKDEDEEDEEPAGAAGGGMPDFGGMDFSSLGGMGGMGGMGGGMPDLSSLAGMGGMGDDDDEGSDGEDTEEMSAETKA
ncbi:p23 chaperone protein wos2 [Tieghemiomyces parasiticus]|uniref:P23 chaperone protein wos2 n=1 Tax=Tieghemiomyces parasiticus TaxID=78921 RepID=A0A9W8DJW7_9FUNG|nr:p23 chaperone protein wos2 [Tieghemiomyces parasiticus]